MMKNNGWTPEKIQKLKALAAKGITAAAIGKVIGMTRNAVVGKAYRLKIKIGHGDKLKKSRKPKRLRTVTVARSVSLPAPWFPTEDGPSRKHPSISTVENGQCRFPLWDDVGPTPADSPLCGLPSGCHTYCREHSDICYSRPEEDQ